MSIRDERKQQSRQALLDAALKLSTSGRAFSTISLREIAREVGLVPTAFYRHFDDMEKLGEALVAQVAEHLRQIILHLRQGYFSHHNAKTRTSLELFFRAVDQNQQDWLFLIAERWGGSVMVRNEINKEIEILIQDLAKDFDENDNFKTIKNPDDLPIISSIIINLSFTWAMTWLSLNTQFSGMELVKQQQWYIDQVSTQVQLLFRGIANWEK